MIAISAADRKPSRIAPHGRIGSRNYGDRDKGLAPLSLCESR
jgi:hypothetical protein